MKETLKIRVNRKEKEDNINNKRGCRIKGFELPCGSSFLYIFYKFVSTQDFNLKMCIINKGIKIPFYKWNNLYNKD